MEPKSLFERAVEASRWLNRIEPERIDRVLLSVADAAERRSDDILAANREDLARKDPSDPMYDRLQLTPERITGIAADMRNVASLPSPLGLTLDERMRPNGMKIRKVSVPFGVIGVIYEARPNVGFDVFSLCLKAGSACVLKGGSDARDSNAAIAELIRDVLRENGFDEHCVTLMPPGREATTALLEAVGQIDLVIPRGSKGLIDYVRDHARVPVIETGAGVCHTYFDREGDLEKGARIVFNAKTRRVSVCNALDCLIVHRERLADLPELCGPLAERQVVILAGRAYRSLLVASQRGGRVRECRNDSRVPAACRRGLRLCQRFYGLYGRSPVRFGRRDRYQYAEVARPGTDGSARADDIQVSDRRRRPDPRVMGADRFSARPS